MKRIASLFSLLALFAFSSEAMAQASPYDLKGRYPKEAGIYVAPKFVYSNQKAKGDGSEKDSALGGGLGIGYNFAHRKDMFPMRLELEYLMREKSEMTMGSYLHRYSVDTLMLNAAIGLNTGTKFTPYLTGGIGIAFHEAQAKDSSTTKKHDNSDFSWSVGADLTYKLNTNILLGLEYRYIDLGSSKLKTTVSDGQDLTAHEVIFAVRFKF